MPVTFAAPRRPPLRTVHNVRDQYGAKGDTRRVFDAAINTGVSPNTLTSATAAFVAADVGKTVRINGAGSAGSIHVTTIASRTNSTTVTLTEAANDTVSGALAEIGSDDTDAIAAAVTAAIATNGLRRVYLPPGRYFTDTITGLQHDFDFAGAGPQSTVLVSRDGNNVIEITGKRPERLTVRDLGIMGAGQAVGDGHGIHIHDTYEERDDDAQSPFWQVRFYNLYIRETGRHGIAIGDTTDPPVTNDSTVWSSSFRDIVLFDTGDHCIYMQASGPTVIFDNVMFLSASGATNTGPWESGSTYSYGDGRGYGFFIYAGQVLLTNCNGQGLGGGWAFFGPSVSFIMDGCNLEEWGDESTGGAAVLTNTATGTFRRCKWGVSHAGTEYIAVKITGESVDAIEFEHPHFTGTDKWANDHAIHSTSLTTPIISTGGRATTADAQVADRYWNGSNSEPIAVVRDARRGFEADYYDQIPLFDVGAWQNETTGAVTGRRFKSVFVGEVGGATDNRGNAIKPGDILVYDYFRMKHDTTFGWVGEVYCYDTNAWHRFGPMEGANVSFGTGSFTGVITANGGVNNTQDETLQITSAKTSADGAHSVDVNTTARMGATNWGAESYLRIRNNGTVRMQLSDVDTFRSGLVLAGVNNHFEIYLDSGFATGTGRLDIWGSETYLNAASIYASGNFELNYWNDIGGGNYQSRPLKFRNIINSATFAFGRVNLIPAADDSGEMRLAFAINAKDNLGDVTYYEYLTVLNGTDAAGATGGKVGINNTAPAAALDVVGNADISGTVTANAFVGDGSGLTGISGGSTQVGKVSGSNFTTTLDTPQDVTGMSFTMEANATYQVTIAVRSGCSGTGGMRWRFTGPAGASLLLTGVGNVAASPNHDTWTAFDSNGNIARAWQAANSQTGGILFTGQVTCGGTGGTFQVQVNSVTSGQTTTIYVDSSVSATKAT